MSTFGETTIHAVREADDTSSTVRASEAPAPEDIVLTVERPTGEAATDDAEAVA